MAKSSGGYSETGTASLGTEQGIPLLLLSTLEYKWTQNAISHPQTLQQTLNLVTPVKI